MSNYIMNPQTGRGIRIGGRVYKYLIRDGVIDEQGKILNRNEEKKIEYNEVKLSDDEIQQLTPPKLERQNAISAVDYEETDEDSDDEYIYYTF